MSQKIPTIWELDPHTGAKHLILRQYIGGWVSIISQSFNRAVFIDGFSGPGEYAGGEKGSPIISLQEATSALVKAGPTVKKPFSLDMYFVEQDSKRIAHLKQKLETVTSDSRIITHEPIHGEFELVLPKILEEVKRKYPGVTIPTLVFIDPFGVKGFSLKTLRLILENKSSEVLALFDIDGINRLLTSAEAMLEVFGEGYNESIPSIMAEPDPKTKFSMIRQLHQSAVNEFSKFYLPFKMKSTSRAELYDLVFLSNSERGFEVMKDAMWKVDESGSFHFVDAEYDELAFKFATAPDELWQILLKIFSGKLVSGMEVDRFVRFKTRFKRTHKTNALKNHEADNCPVQQKITVSSRPRKGTYPDGCEIQFPR